MILYNESSHVKKEDLERTKEGVEVGDGEADMVAHREMARISNGRGGAVRTFREVC